MIHSLNAKYKGFYLSFSKETQLAAASIFDAQLSTAVKKPIIFHRPIVHGCKAELTPLFFMPVISLTH